MPERKLVYTRDVTKTKLMSNAKLSTFQVEGIYIEVVEGQGFNVNHKVKAVRGEGLEKAVMLGMGGGSRSRGRPRRRCMHGWMRW